MVAAYVHAGRRQIRPGIHAAGLQGLIGKSGPDPVRPDLAPGIRLRPEPLPHLSAHLPQQIRAGLRFAEHGRGDQLPAGRRVPVRHAAHHRQVRHRAPALSIQHQDSVADRRLVRLEVPAECGAERRRLGEAREPARRLPVGGKYHGSGPDRVARLERHGTRVDGRHGALQSHAAVGQTVSELPGQRPHSGRRNRDGTGPEHLEHELEHPARGLELRIQEHSAQKGTEERLDHLLAEPKLTQAIQRGHLIRGEDVGDGSIPQSQRQGRDPALVRDRTDRGAQRGQRARRTSERIGDHVKRARTADQRARLERAKVEAIVVQHASRGRVRGQQHLEATVQQESIDDVGARPSPDVVRSLEHDGLPSRLCQFPGAGQTGQTCPYDHDIRFRPHSRLLLVGPRAAGLDTRRQLRS